MRVPLVSAKSSRSRMSASVIACAFFVALTAMENDARAAHRRDERRIVSVESRAVGEPILAIVSLHNQRITIYDADGWILRSSVSSGQRGRETPAGIFSIIQKEAEHYSNLYDDAYMPNMERITWSGIALHGGVVPGYPASHGCVRMPYQFAKRLFDQTRLGLRVIVSPTDVVPSEIVHPILSRSKPDDGASSSGHIAQADDVAKKADQARRAAGAAFREATRATMQVRVAENWKRRAEAQLAIAEAALSSASSTEDKQQAERSKSEAAARISEADAQLGTAKTELQPKLDALKAARDDAIAAGSAQAAAAETTQQAAREQDPISVLVSRKTQRLYVRQDFEPLFDSPVTIVDADRPMGTHIYTAMAKVGGGMRWSVVSLNSEQTGDGSMDESAKNALDRIVIPQEALDRISWITPRSSLIVTDEALSSETGKGTDFVVLLSGEPQGGIKMRRRRPPETDAIYAVPRNRVPNSPPPFTNWYSTW
jgi:L,D-transpeptidase catalytic domain